MRKHAILIFTTLILFATTSSLAQQEEKTLSLTLEECIMKALRQNLGVAVELMNPEVAELRVSLAKEIFYPTLSFGYNTRENIQASYSFLESGGDVQTTRSGYDVGISQLLPIGGTFSISLDGYSTETNQRFQSVNPRYGATLRFDFSQPLLRNFGTKTTKREIIVARNNLDISETQLELSLQQTVYDVENAYWSLKGLIENLKVRQLSLQLAEELLEKNKRSVEVGTLAPIEILSSQSAVASRKADIIQAESQIKDAEDSLRILLNLSAEGIADVVRIIPVDSPDFEKREINFEEAFQTALQKRPDLNGSRINLKNREIDVKNAKNQLLPGLNLSASYWSPGISGTELIFDPINPFGNPIGENVYPASDAVSDAFNFVYNNWSVALTLDIPLDNIFSKANYAQTKLNMEQSLLMLKDQEQQIFLEVKSAVRAVQTNYERVQAYEVALDLAEETLKAEEEKFKVGISTPYFVLQYQTELTTAQTNLLIARYDYVLSLARLERSLGTSLEKRNIKYSDFRGK
jgi:outer membrane protein TolC